MEHVNITFQTTATMEEVWAFFTEVDCLSKWHGGIEIFEAWSGGRIRFHDQGWDPVEGTISDIEPCRLIQWVIPDDGSEITETFASSNEDVRVRIQQHWFEYGQPGDGIEGRIRGWEESIADLLLLLDHGVAAPRHMAPRAKLGVTTADTMAGLVVAAIAPGTQAESAGLRPGDILITFGNAPIYRRSDLAVLLRAYRDGDVATVKYVRDSELREVEIRLA